MLFLSKRCEVRAVIVFVVCVCVFLCVSFYDHFAHPDKIAIVTNLIQSNRERERKRKTANQITEQNQLAAIEQKKINSRGEEMER